MDKIKEIALNPEFLTNDVYKSFENQGISVRWMNNEEINESEQKKIFIVITQ